ncbi:hypothetical protein SESBI_34638 [Sesbania bispinosa]|nr:hypothetical protein SESBI_34638 [Sesbania bispinosa]
MRDIGSDNGIPQKMLETLNWDCIEHFSSVRDKPKARINSYEPSGQEGRTMRGSEDQLGVKLANLLESEASLEKGIKGIKKFMVAGQGNRSSKSRVC